MKKINIIVTVISIFLVLVGLSFAVQRLLMNLGLFWQIVANFAILASGIYFIDQNRGDNRAKEIATIMLLLYASLLLPHDGYLAFNVIAVALYFYEWRKWEKSYRKNNTGCYSRWMTYNIMLLSFIFGSNILSFWEQSTSPIGLIGIAALWLAMSVSLALKLRD